MPPSNNVITSFLSTLIGQPHFGAEGPRNASIVTRRTFPYVGGAAGHETRLRPRALRKLPVTIIYGLRIGGIAKFCAYAACASGA